MINTASLKKPAGGAPRHSAEEEALRVAAEAWARARWPAARIVHELVLERGSQRIDLAVVGDEEIRLIEIKSAKDVLTRLQAQISAGLQCASEVWVAVDAKHIDKIDPPVGHPALSELPWSVGLLVLRDGVLSERRQTYPHQPDPRAVARLLWAEELRVQFGYGARDNHSTMVRRAVDTYGLREIHRRVCRGLKGRSFPRADDAIDATPAPAEIGRIV